MQIKVSIILKAEIVNFLKFPRYFLKEKYKTKSINEEKIIRVPDLEPDNGMEISKLITVKKRNITLGFLK